MQRFGLERQLEVLRIPVDHRQIVVLAAFVETKPKPEAVGERHLFLDGFRGVYGGGLLVFHHVAGQQVSAVGRRIEQNVCRAPLDAAVENRLQRLVGGIVVIEGEIVAEDDHGHRRRLQDFHQHGQGGDILPVYFDELDCAGGVVGDLCVDRLDQ